MSTPRGKGSAQPPKACAHPGCQERFQATRSNQLYCVTHRAPIWTSRRFELQKKTKTLPPSKAAAKAPSKQSAKPEAAKPASTVAAAISKLRAKASTTPAAARELGRQAIREPAQRSGHSAFDDQVGGDHYKTMAIQPVEFIARNSLGFCEGNVIKYVCRHSIKGGVEDLNKAIHYLQLLRETRYG